jgi:hypothetical protein
MHDLFGREFVLLTRGARGTTWGGVLAASQNGVPVRHYRIGAPESRADVLDLDGTWDARYGIEGEGAVLVRPDGHVCWRARGGPDDHTGPGLPEALATALGRHLKGDPT